MNVHERLFAASALAALALAGGPLAAQSAQAGPQTPTSAFAAVGIVPTALVGSVGSVPSDSGSATAATSSSASVATLRGPSLSSARVASHRISTSHGAAPLFQEKKSNKNSVALMIVGGAALVVGAVIGDDAGTLVMLGGAAVGLYGLYLFLT